MRKELVDLLKDVFMAFYIFFSMPYPLLAALGMTAIWLILAWMLTLPIPIRTFAIWSLILVCWTLVPRAIMVALERELKKEKKKKESKE